MRERPFQRVLCALAASLLSLLCVEPVAATPPVSLGGDSDFDPRHESALFTPLPEDHRVRFADVLQAPDDIPLNFRYAQTQVRDGNLKGASATLERILLVEPALPRVRLFYGIVLLRLGNFEEAERELSRVKRHRLSPSLAEEVDRHLARIADSRRTNRGSVSLAFGSQYDANRNASPASGEMLWQDNSLVVTDESLAEDDFAFLAALRGEWANDLPLSGAKWGAGLSLVDSEQIELSRLTLQAVSLETGPRFEHRWLTWRAEATGSFVALDREPYLGSGGLRLRGKSRLSPRLELHGDVHLEYQSFQSVSGSRTADLRTGLRSAASLGARFALGRQWLLSGALQFNDKQADAAHNAFRSYGVQLSPIWIPARGHVLQASGSLRYDTYAEPHLFVSSKRRTDTQIRTQLRYAVELGALLPERRRLRWLAPWSASLRVEHLESRSNLTNFAYRNWSAGFLLSRRFEL